MSKRFSIKFDVTFLDLLTLLLIGLKLSGHVKWSWVWVLLPQWIVFVLPLTRLFIVFWMRVFRRMKELGRSK